jgi:hypothetical protein
MPTIWPVGLAGTAPGCVCCHWETIELTRPAMPPEPLSEPGLEPPDPPWLLEDPDPDPEPDPELDPDPPLLLDPPLPLWSPSPD